MERPVGLLRRHSAGDERTERPFGRGTDCHADQPGPTPDQRILTHWPPKQFVTLRSRDPACRGCHAAGRWLRATVVIPLVVREGCLAGPGSRRRDDARSGRGARGPVEALGALGLRSRRDGTHAGRHRLVGPFRRHGPDHVDGRDRGRHVPSRSHRPGRVCSISTRTIQRTSCPISSVEWRRQRRMRSTRRYQRWRWRGLATRCAGYRMATTSIASRDGSGRICRDADRRSRSVSALRTHVMIDRRLGPRAWLGGQSFSREPDPTVMCAWAARHAIGPVCQFGAERPPPP